MCEGRGARAEAARGSRNSRKRPPPPPRPEQCEPSGCPLGVGVGLREPSGLSAPACRPRLCEPPQDVPWAWVGALGDPSPPSLGAETVRVISPRG